jgi:hypothetical protein
MVVLWRAMAIAAVAAVFLAYAGAFGSGAAPFLRRLAYWVETMVVSSAIGAGMFIGAGRLGLMRWGPSRFIAVLAVGMSLPITGVVWLSGGLFFAAQSPIVLKTLLLTYPPVLIVCGLMTAINFLVRPRPAHIPGETHASPPGTPPPRFLERLPSRLRGADLYAVQAEDHYLRLHTSRGSDLILLRLADAVAELEGLEGAQTHRSWWVAREAVQEARRADGRAVLTLRNGVQAPVSRRYAAALREAGWF